MARPSNANSFETQERIVSAARELLAEDGPEGVSVRRVASRAGLSVGAIRHYFASQEELLVEAGLTKYYDQLDDFRRQFFKQLCSRESATVAVSTAASAAFHFCRSQTTALELRARATTTGRHLGDRREATSRLPFLREFAQKLSPFTERSPEELRFAAQSLIFLIARFGFLEDAALLDLVDSDDPAEAVRRTEAHLRGCALWLLGLDDGEEPHL